MSDLRQCSRQFLTDFISMYQNYPSLWRVKSKEYANRDKKGEAYEVLLKKYQEVDPTAVKETIIRKINSLRTVYRRELAKLNKSMLSGAGEDEVYKPSLWYFDLLHFLNDQETPRLSRNSMDEREESVNCDKSFEQVEDVHETDAESGQNDATLVSETHYSGNTSHQAARKRKRVVDDTTYIMKLLEKKLESLQADDSFDIFGKYVANKLRDVPSYQSKISQKLISEILFEADMGKLSRNFRVVDMTSRQDDHEMDERNLRQQYVPHLFRMPQTQVGQQHPLSHQWQPMPHSHVPEELPQTKEYETIGQIAVD